MPRNKHFTTQRLRARTLPYAHLVFHQVLIVALVGLATGRAHASTDINGLFDGRSAGMGGTGVAFIDSPAAIPINPALLDQIGKLSISADLFYIVSQPEGPYTVFHLDPATGEHFSSYETIRSSPTSAPLPFLGVAYRIVDRVVIGLAAYPVIGQGASAKYQPAPDELPNLWATNHVEAGLFEMGEAISVKVLDNLSLAGMWRINYMTQTASSPVNTGGAPAGVLLNRDRTQVANADFSIKGLNFTGFEFGVFYKPIPSLRLGFSYRSKVVVEGTGKAKTTLGTSVIELDAKSTFTNPHAFRAGLAWSLFDEKLLLATDFKYLMYAEAYKEIKTTTTMANGMSSDKLIKAYWKDSWVVQLGAEYKLSDVWSARAGYIILQSATNADYALAYFAPPGYSQLVSLGVGIKALDHLDVDIAAAYVVLASYVDKATLYNSGVGNYASHSGEFSLSLAYHL
jgi:long-chain fatty acid transport protein